MKALRRLGLVKQAGAQGQTKSATNKQKNVRSKASTTESPGGAPSKTPAVTPK